MNYKLLMDTALLAGEIMLSGGAETYRVEDTIGRILKISELEITEVLVTATGVFVTLNGESIDPITLVKRVDKRSTNLNRIYLANDISRRLCSKELELNEAYKELNHIRNIEQYKDSVIWLATICSTAFFCALLGGNFRDCGLAALNGCFLALCIMGFKKIQMNYFVTNMAASILVAVNTMLFVSAFNFPLNMELIITASIMPLVPGVAITNAIRDTLTGDYMAGGAKAMEAFVIAVSIAVGIGAGLGMFTFVMGGKL